MNPAARELHARKRRRAAMLASVFPEQRAAILDQSRLKALFCTRRAGKSWAIGLYLFLVAMTHPGSSCLYLGLTRGSAHGTMLKDIFRVLNKAFAIGAHWHDTKSYWELPNGSLIYLRGADANAYEIGKVLGQKYRLAVLDEASKYRYEVRAMVYGALLPAMGDDLGTIVLAGTPSNITTGLFYDVTNGVEPGWSMHHWTWRENVFRRANIQRAHDEYVAKNPLVVTTPLYRQEWLGEWVVDTSALVYKAREDLNTIAELPKAAGGYTYVLGVDTGFRDATAFVVSAYSEHDATLYLVEAHKQSGIIYSTVAETIQRMERVYGFGRIVLDAPLQGAEEMRQRFGLPLVATEKAGKKSVIDLFNSDLLTGRIKVLPAAMGLFEEWGSLIWDEKARAKIPAGWVEDGRFDNHLADAALYAWRASRNYTAVPAPQPKPEAGTPAWVDQWIDGEYEYARRRHERGGRPILDQPTSSLAMRYSTR